MGRKKIEKPSSDELLSIVSKMLVPEFILEHFEIYGAKESPNEWVIAMREKEGLIPSELRDDDVVVFDGFERPIDTYWREYVY
ncbi:MAG: hypothetical protein LBU51_01900 [Bacteroidales bacterium]|jgi:hypothetical protein|nr:hypothetical protein [Bacteroidales bacterium]